MPGIVGLVTAMPRELAERQLRRMVEALRHEPFYESGRWTDASLGVYAGWSAPPNRVSAALPRDGGGDVAVLFAGEDFSEADAARRPDATCDAERIRRAYEEDPTFPAGLNGRFHGLVVDRRRRTALLFNDRYGMRRVYCHRAPDGFYFAAESKAILAVRPELGTIDSRGLGELVACGCVLENRTLFAGIDVLPAAAKWLLRDGGVVREATYFRPQEWEAQPQLEVEAYYRELRQTFGRILPRYFSGPERIGMSLTGGLDTRMILAQQRPAAGTLPCYTFGGMFRESQDVVVARQVATACGQSHQVLRVDEELLARFPAYAERTVYLSDACADVSRAPDLYLNQCAREIAPVRMTGNYGGEILRRVRAFKPTPPPADLFSPDFRSAMRQAEDAYAALLHGHPLSFAVFKQAPWHHHGLLALEETQLAVRSPYLDNDLVRTVFRAPASVVTDDELCLRLIDDAGPAALREIPTDRGRGGRGVSAWAAHALRELEFKAEYAYDYGMPQWAVPIDRLLSPLRPERLFLGRHKFSHFRMWYAGVLSGYVRDVLLDPTTLSRPHLSGKKVETMVRDHLQRRRNYTREIHTLLTIELAHRLFT